MLWIAATALIAGGIAAPIHKSLATGELAAMPFWLVYLPVLLVCGVFAGLAKLLLL